MVENKAIAAAPIIKNVVQSIIFDSHPLLYCPIILSLAAILTIRNKSGTATIPLITAV